MNLSNLNQWRNEVSFQVRSEDGAKIMESESQEVFRNSLLKIFWNGCWFWNECLYEVNSFQHLFILSLSMIRHYIWLSLFIILDNQNVRIVPFVWSYVCSLVCIVVHALLFNGAFNANQRDGFHSIFLASLCYLHRWNIPFVTQLLALPWSASCSSLNYVNNFWIFHLRLNWSFQTLLEYLCVSRHWS